MKGLSVFGGLLAAFASVAFAQVPPASAPVTSAVEAPAYSGPTVYVAKIKATYPHDTASFTQGLLWHDGALYESTGQVGRSRVRKVDLETGTVLADQPIPATHFGEGLAVWEDNLVSLTWTDGAVHRWNIADLSHVSSIDDFGFEGWGLTSTDEGLVFSDGTDLLRVIDPETYDVERVVTVTIMGRPLRQLNELEYVDGLIYANIWYAPYIVAIDPVDGVVKKVVDLSGIIAQTDVDAHGAVLNGIAWDADSRRLFVTGKLWPAIYEIEMTESDARVR